MDENLNQNTEDAAEKMRREALSGWSAMETGAEKLEDAAQGTVEAAKETAEDGWAAATAAANDVKAEAENAWQQAENQVERAADQVAYNVEKTGDAVAREVSEAAGWGTESASVVPSFDNWKSQNQPVDAPADTWNPEIYKAPEPEPVVVPPYVAEAPVRPVEPQVTPPASPASTWPQTPGPTTPPPAQGTYAPSGSYVPPVGAPPAKSSKLPTWAIVLLVILGVLCLCCVIGMVAFPGLLTGLSANSFVPFFHYLV